MRRHFSNANTPLLLLLATSFRDSLVGSCQRVTPRKKLTLGRHWGTLTLGATLRDDSEDGLSSSLDSPHCGGLRMQSSVMKVQMFPFNRSDRRLSLQLLLVVVDDVIWTHAFLLSLGERFLRFDR